MAPSQPAYNVAASVPIRSCGAAKGFILTTVLGVVGAFVATYLAAPMIIERCTFKNFEDWVRLRQALWPDQTLEEHRRYAASILNRLNEAATYLARERHGNVVAFAEATLRRDYVNGCSTSPAGFLEGLYVEAPYRRRGLARLLCETLADWAAGLGCAEFASDVLLHNEAGQRVHEALGFQETERVVYYVKRLERK